MHVEKDPRAWAQRTFGECELGDERRTRRLVILGSSLGAHVGSSPYTACRGDEAANEGAYRLLRNAAVEPEAIAEGGFFGQCSCGARVCRGAGGGGHHDAELQPRGGAR